MLLEDNERFRADYTKALIYHEIDLHTPPVIDMSNYCILHNRIIRQPPHVPDWRSQIPDCILELLCANVVLAGGSLVTLLNNNNNVKDWDLFIIGGKNNDILKDIIAKLGGKTTISRGLVNIFINGLKIQIILRAIPSISALIYGFDLPNCAIAFDGRELYMSQLALYSFHFNLLFVSVLYCSPSFIHRIFKYYNKFNYSICILDIDKSKMTKNIAIGRLLFIMDDDYVIIRTKLLKNRANDKISWLESKIAQVLEPLHYVNPYMIIYEHFTICKYNEVILSIIGRLGMVAVEYKSGILESTLREIVGIREIASFDIVYREVFCIIYGAEGGHQKKEVKKNLRLLFPPNVLIMLRDSKITLKQAVKIIYDDALHKFNKIIEYWIIADPSSQFDMRFHPLDLSVDQFYKLI